MEYTVEEIPAASWRPGLPQALACYRIVHETRGTILETPDATETDERNAKEVAHALNVYPVLVEVLGNIQDAVAANWPPSERLKSIENWASAALGEANGNN